MKIHSMHSGFLMLAIFVSLLIPASSNASLIYGRLKVQGEAVSTSTEIVIKSSKKTYTTRPKATGEYSVMVKEEGKCTLTVKGASITVYSLKKPCKYNLYLSNLNGKYKLEKR